MHDVFYRLRTCYTLSWGEEINLPDYEVSIAPFSTAIALYPKDTSTTSTNEAYNALTFSQSTVKDLEVFTGSGEKIYNIKWDEDKLGKIIHFSWSAKEELIIVLDNGTFRNYYDFEDNFYEFSLGHDAENIGISDVRFYTSGFVVRLKNNSFIHVGNYQNPYPSLVQFQSTPTDEQNENILTKQIHSWEIVPPLYSLSKNIEILISSDSTIYSLNEISTDNKQFNKGPISMISVSPNGDLLALFAPSTNKAYILTSDFQRTLNEFQVSLDEIPSELKWCGNDVVVMVINNDEVKVIGPGEDYLSFYFDSNVYLFSEIDGIRLLTNEKLEFFSRVPNQTVDIFKIGSTTPSSILLDSIDLKNSSDPTENITALENISIIGNSLEEAINSCIEVSTEEFDQYWQKKLLKAATFAKTHLEFYNSEYLIEVEKNLKILNQIRSYKVGMFLTYKQFELFDLNTLVNNLLLKRQHYLLSIKISEYLDLPLDLIYIDWCSSKIKYSSSLSDEVLFNEVLKKLGKIKNISFDTVSRVAYQEGRTNLSIMLINHEPISSKKIPLLIEMEEDELAVVKAEETLNYRLIEYVIFYLQNKLSLSEFLKVLNNKKVSLSFWENLMKHLGNWHYLKSYYLSFDKNLSVSNLNLILGSIGKTEEDLVEDNTALSKIKLKEVSPSINSKYINNLTNEELSEVMHKFESKQKSVSHSIKIYEEIKNNNKQVQDDLKYLKQELKLIEMQEMLQKTYTNLNFFGRSIIETLTLLIIINNYDTSSSESSAINKRIHKLLREFKINEKRYYLLVIEKLSEYKKWAELYSFANHKKSPVGYEPFYKVCIKNNAIRQAGLYIDLVGSSVNYTKKIKMYLRVGNFKSAGEEAFKNKDSVKLREILKLYKQTGHPNSAVVQLIEDYLRKLH